MKMTAIAALLVFSFQANAAIKVFVDPIIQNYPNNVYAFVNFYSTTSQTFVSYKLVFLPKDNSILTTADAIAYIKSATYTEAGVQGYSITDADFITNWSMSGFNSRTFTNNASHSTTTGTGATGFQVSSSHDARVNYSLSTSTTATIGGASTATAILEIAPTNSATAGDWVEIARVSNGQTITLAIVLQSIQTTSGVLSGTVPAGYYAKIRTITSGTASVTYSSGQEVLEP